ncbi:histidine phosphatase family protein [Pseudomonas sp. KU43P]|uniref:lipopolysaccharide core heptose(II)-phosphate phosphatase PmrG n=1 Tax=Pseudomonas sp. KU43P TaxID=2487887 RepID=UPI0012A8BBA6|nr:histidine phosphatase family protein [Pseudomonas sp. KU43P]BBH46411.1 histidine phosphatase family protein [Pseudomonas sp. KU43P]
MLENVIETPLPPVRARRLPGLLGVLLAVLSLGLWHLSRAQVSDLSSTQQMSDHGVYSAWAKGEVIVLIRHAERCDRSNHACLNDPAGITVDGSHAAKAVGDGIVRLGLGSADMLSSPEVRTRQTASFIFGKAIETQDWLMQCDSTFADAAFAHKHEARNLILVTHSGCIDQLERQLDVPGGERDSGYASALFVTKGSDGQPHILGQLNAKQWRELVSDTGK